MFLIQGDVMTFIFLLLVLAISVIFFQWKLRESNDKYIDKVIRPILFSSGSLLIITAGVLLELMYF